MSIVQATTTYKKKDGTLKLVGEALTWTPSTQPGSPPTVTIAVVQITNLQATPPTSAKVMLKVFVQKDGDPNPEAFVFAFTATSARAEADAMKDALTAAIQSAKGGSTSGANTPRAGVASSAAMAAVAGARPSMADMLNRSRLEADSELQQSLLKSDSALANTFADTVLKGEISPTQFWSTRIHLLRAHAIEKSQSRGPYNVLASIRPTTVDGVARMSLSRDQIHDIFEQHPLVKTVYDENVPKLSEDQFWARFFQSRLLKMLKGEKILPNDPTDNVFDKYLTRDDEENSRKRRRIEHVPLTLDLGGNEQHVSKRGGNQPDITMRPSKLENVPIIRTLNSLSQKLVDLVTPADVDQSENSDDRYITEQRLTDLGAEPEEERIILNIQDQRAFFSSSSDANATSSQYAGLDPPTVLQEMRNSLGTKPIDLAAMLPDDNDNPPPGAPKPLLFKATIQITAAVRERSSQLSTGHSGANSTGASAATGGLPPKVFDSVKMVHATTNEFLRHFWDAFLSGDEKRAKDINSMVTSLRNSRDRIAAIAKTADEEREIEQVKRKKQLQEEYKITGIRPKKKDMEVGGGSKVVEEMLAPTVHAIQKALEKYQTALEETEKERGGSGGGATPLPVA